VFTRNTIVANVCRVAVTLLIAASASAQPVLDAPKTEGLSGQTGRPIDVEGIAEFREGDALLINGYRVRGDAATKFEGKEVGSWSGIRLGHFVALKGRVQADGSVTAVEVHARTRDRSNAGRGVVTGALEQEGKWLSGGGSIFRAALMKNSPETRLPKADPEYERVSTILQRMVPAYLEEPLRLHLVSSPDWNARGLPNGSIAVAAGLLKDMDDDEIAIIVGHELAHITHQHAQKTLANAERRKMVTELIADIAPTGGAVAGIALSVGGAVALKAWQSGYSRSLEDEADRVGLGYAAAGGYDVRKAPRVWERFQEKYGNENAIKNLVVGNHPRNSARAQNAQRHLAAHYPNYVPKPRSGMDALPLAPRTIRAAMPGVGDRDAQATAIAATPGSQLVSGSTPSIAPPASSEITKGMTFDQVRTLLGAPKQEFIFKAADGKRTKWVFAYLSVTFLDGRVETVEF